MKSVKKILVHSLFVTSLMMSASAFSFTISVNLDLNPRKIAYGLSAAGLTVFMAKKQVGPFVSYVKEQGVRASFSNHLVSCLGIQVVSALLLLDAARQQHRLEEKLIIEKSRIPRPRKIN